MAITATWEKYGALFDYVGDVSFFDFLENHKSVLVHTDFTSFRHVIHDMRLANLLHYSDSDILRFAAQELGARYTNRSFRTAFVSDSPEISRMVEKTMDVSKMDIPIFTNITDAISWTKLKIHLFNE